MTREELSKLKQGDVVRHEQTGAGYIVLSNRAGVPTVVRSIELHNGSEWSHVYTPTPVAPEPSILGMIEALESRGWKFTGARWIAPDDFVEVSLRRAYEQRENHYVPLIVKAPRPTPTPRKQVQELEAAGWKREGMRWTKPGTNFCYPYTIAWKILDNDRVSAVTAAGARPVKSFQDARASLVAAGWKNICGRVWLSPSGCHFDGTKLAYDALTEGDGTCNAS